LTDVAQRALPSDVLVLYAAGHGLMVQCPGDEEPRYHLLTYRASLRSEPTICQHGVSDRRLAELVRAVPARKKLVVLDTCQAGAAATEKTLVAMRGAVEIDAIKRLARAEGVAIVAAAKAAEYAGEVPALGHGIFTYALVQGLAGRAAAGPGPVSVFGLLGYLQSEVPALSEQHFGRPQFPITSLQGQDFPLSIIP
ncbi:caspase family protein, partial [Myxococcota bacterium]|nr:caspase family protein [Myxococcota bacterium]